LIKLCWHHVDLDGGKIHVPGDSQRSLPVNETLTQFLNSVRSDANQSETAVLSDGQGKPFTVDDVRTLIVYTSLDAGIDGAQEITPQAIRYSYLAFLLSQGARFADIGRLSDGSPPTRWRRALGWYRHNYNMCRWRRSNESCPRCATSSFAEPAT
jgi:site-specific recombinase XerD